MAKCSAHGTEIGTIYTGTKAYRFMSDGHILKNAGHGWKLHRKLKPGIVPQDIFAQRIARQQEIMNQKPALKAYRKVLHDMTGLSKRWKLELAISHMPNDPDGVWSECCDGYGDNVHADISEISELCRLYQAAISESKNLVEQES